jgi:hypothetical protein
LRFSREGGIYLGVGDGLEVLEESKHIGIVCFVVGLMQMPAQPRVHICQVHYVHVFIKGQPVAFHGNGRRIA